MKRFPQVGAWFLGFFALLLMPTFALAQLLDTPQPGDIFKEFSRRTSAAVTGG